MPKKSKKQPSARPSKQTKKGKQPQRSAAKQPARHAPAHATGGLENVLSGCAADYARSLARPWGKPGACLPYGVPLPSQKFQTWVKGTAQTGTSTGYVAFNPYLAVTSDIQCVAYSDNVLGNFAGNSVTLTAATTGVGGLNANSPYAAAAFSAGGLSYRVVSAGIRVKYIGTEVARGGRIICYEDSKHVSVSGATIASILGDPHTGSLRPSGGDDWYAVVWTGPANATDPDYQITTFETPGTATVLTIMWDGTAAATPYEFECYANFEVVGGVVSVTPSHHDSEGAGIASNAVRSAQNANGHSGHDDFLKDAGKAIVSYAGHAASGLANQALDYVKNNAGSLLLDAGKIALTLL